MPTLRPGRGSTGREAASCALRAPALPAALALRRALRLLTCCAARAERALPGESCSTCRGGALCTLMLLRPEPEASAAEREALPAPPPNCSPVCCQAGGAAGAAGAAGLPGELGAAAEEEEGKEEKEEEAAEVATEEAELRG